MKVYLESQASVKKQGFSIIHRKHYFYFLKDHYVSFTRTSTSKTPMYLFWFCGLGGSGIFGLARHLGFHSPEKGSLVILWTAFSVLISQKLEPAEIA